jgi:hypothetical protein
MRSHVGGAPARGDHPAVAIAERIRWWKTIAQRGTKCTRCRRRIPRGYTILYRPRPTPPEVLCDGCAKFEGIEGLASVRWTKAQGQ